MLISKKTWLWSLLLILTWSVSLQIFKIEKRQQANLEDLAVIHDVKYGLFNVDEWKLVLAEIITEKVENFEVNDGNREELKGKIEGLLWTVINDFERSYHQENSQTLFGIVKNVGSELFGVFNKLKRDIPSISNHVVTFMDDPDNRKMLKNFLLSKINEYADETFAKTNYTELNNVLIKHGVDSPAKCSQILEANTNSNKKHVIYLQYASLLIWIVSIVALSKGINSLLELKLIVLTVLPWLFTGVLLPMLLINARIDSLEFYLLGEHIQFTNQVIFQRSKSIYEVVKLLVMSGKGASMVAGISVLLFSVIVPLAKMIPAFFWSPKVNWHNTYLGQIFMFKASKWSMADVMVVAIFIAYLGFQGVLNDQIGRLETVNTQLKVFTTANSSLMPGFLAFLGFVVLSIVLSIQFEKLCQEN